MEIGNPVIRPMHPGEEQEIQTLGKACFQMIEKLFVGKPKHAMVAEYDGKIVGAIIIAYMNPERSVAYMDEGFVDPQYQGLGIGKKMYRYTFDYLRDNGCRYLTAMIKDDNVGSWKNAMAGGFHRVTLWEAVKHLGFSTFLRQYFCSPMLISLGMDFYLLSNDKPLREKRETPFQWLSFLLCNLLLAFPVWLILFLTERETCLPGIAAYATILGIFVVTRCLGALCSGTKFRFRMNNCGGLLTFGLGILNNLFPMNANWYPTEYENSDRFRRKLALPELVKWALFLPLPLLDLLPSPYCKMLAEMSIIFLLFSLLPFYPFDALGAGRIFRYKKWLWIVTSALSALVLTVSYFI